MAHFPTLRTGAITQYPSERSTQVPTASFRFVDGAEQRFARSAAPLKRWLIRMELLDDVELFALEHFFIEQGGAAQEFAFTDPWDLMDHARCSFENDDVMSMFQGIGDGVM